MRIDNRNDNRYDICRKEGYPKPLRYGCYLKVCHDMLGFENNQTMYKVDIKRRRCQYICALVLVPGHKYKPHNRRK